MVWESPEHGRKGISGPERPARSFLSVPELTNCIPPSTSTPHTFLSLMAALRFSATETDPLTAEEGQLLKIGARLHRAMIVWSGHDVDEHYYTRCIEKELVSNSMSLISYTTNSIV